MNNNLLKVAKQAALEAGKIISKYRGKAKTINVKNVDSSDFSTEADIEAEEIIVEILVKNFPNHNIIAEEKTNINNNSRYCWIVDPLDGTISFKIGMPYFAVSIALLEDNISILGVIYHISTKDLYWAEKDQGAFLNGKKIHVSKQENLPTATMALDLGHMKRRLAKIDLYVLPLLKRLGYIYSIGSGVMCMGLVAKGMHDGMAAQGFPWDFASGAIIVKESGGQVTDFEGKEIDWTKERINVLASNGLIHNQILEALKS